jgi:hypothetical protein
VGSDREKERAARNKAVIARMGVPPTMARILAELDLEISDALQLAAARRDDGAVIGRNGRRKGVPAPRSREVAGTEFTRLRRSIGRAILQASAEVCRAERRARKAA